VDAAEIVLEAERSTTETAITARAASASAARLSDHCAQHRHRGQHRERDERPGRGFAVSLSLAFIGETAAAAAGRRNRLACLTPWAHAPSWHNFLRRMLRDRDDYQQAGAPAALILIKKTRAGRRSS
jgi:hypothetical protein